MGDRDTPDGSGLKRMCSENQPRSHGERSICIGPAKGSANRQEELKHRGAEIIYTILCPPTNHDIPPTDAMQFVTTKEKPWGKKKTQREKQRNGPRREVDGRKTRKREKKRKQHKRGRKNRKKKSRLKERRLSVIVISSQGIVRGGMPK